MIRHRQSDFHKRRTMKSILCVSVFVVELVGHVASWSYYDLADWPETCQTGQKQSPIPLWKKTAIKLSIPPLVFENYDSIFSTSLENNGHTVEIQILNCAQSDLPRISGANLGEYILDNIHFHWNSEHTINGHRYGLEAHLVHYKVEYENVTVASNHPDGIVVLGVMFEEAYNSNKNLKKIVDATKIISKEVDVPTEVKDLVIDDILPKNKRNFYMYSGSLTTPNCNEVVTWIVLEKPLTIGWSQLKELSDVVTSSGEILRKNLRPLQKLNGRNVFYSILSKH